MGSLESGPVIGLDMDFRNRNPGNNTFPVGIPRGICVGFWPLDIGGLARSSWSLGVSPFAVGCPGPGNLRCVWASLSLDASCFPALSCV